MEKQVYNPFLPENEYIPDAEPHVFGNRLYIYGSHDRFDAGQFCQEDYTVWSAPVRDLSDWTNHGVSYRKSQDLMADADSFMQAPDVCLGFDGRYYLYYALSLKPFVSVAVSEKPEGPFEYYGVVKHENGDIAGLRKNDVFMFDPCVFRDDYGGLYLYCGFSPEADSVFYAATIKYRMNGCYAFKLAEDMLTIKAEFGNVFALDFYEAASMRKFGDKYYLIYSSRAQHDLKWAVSSSPEGGFKPGGTLISNGDLGYMGNKKRKYYTGNNHGSIEKIGDAYYVFYHRHTNRTNYSRQVCAERIRFDGKAFYQAELTSCGLNGKPLLGSGAYPARIACNMWSRDGAVHYGIPVTEGIDDHPYITQNADGKQYIANMREGATAVFKYFSISPNARITANHTGIGSMEISVNDGSIYFTYHGDDISDFHSFIIN